MTPSSTTPRRYTKDSVHRFALAAAGPSGYCLQDAPTLYFRRKNNGPLVAVAVALMVVLFGVTIGRGNRAKLVASPLCNKAVEVCR